MEIAASGLKAKVHRHTRPSRSRQNSGRSDISGIVPNGGEQRQNNSSQGDFLSVPNERTSLLARPLENRDGQPLWEDSRPYVKWPASILITTWRTLASNYVNVLLVFVPLGIIAGVLKWNPNVIFILNFCAIIPLASLLSFATEELSAKLGQTLGGLLNATFGNAVELIVSIVALLGGQKRIVQSSMLGSILSNILLVLGCCFVAGGVRYEHQEFNETMASTMASLMAVSAASLILPATLYAVMHDTAGDKTTEKRVLLLSHGTAIILLVLYVLYLLFQLKTHTQLFDEESSSQEGGEEDKPEGQTLGPAAAAVALVVVTVMVAICAEYLVGSIDSIVKSAGISKTFVGLILLPIVGNAAEHVTAVVVAWKGKMDLAIGVAIGSSMQIALLVTPFLVILGWAIGKPETQLTLHFETFETVVFFVSVLVVNYLIGDGKSNYLEGAMLLGMYIIIALAFYVYPDSAVKGGLNLSGLST